MTNEGIRVAAGRSRSVVTGKRITDVGEKAQRSPWLIAAVLATLCGVIAASLSYYVSEFVLPQVYESSTTLILQNQSTGQTPQTSANTYDQFLADQSMVATFKTLALQYPVAVEASTDAGLSPSQLYGKVTAHVVPTTTLLVLSYQGKDAARTADVVRAYAAAVMRLSVSRQWVPGRTLAVVGDAMTPRAPIRPRVVLNTAVALVAGAAVPLLLLAARRARLQSAA